MLFTNAAMLGVALVMALALDQFFGGVAFLLDHPDLLTAVAKFSFCSAIGQSAIFFTMANFDPLLVTTVTTTRKIFSVLLDIVSRGYVLNGTRWSGVAAASLGVLGELQEFGKKQHAHSKYDRLLSCGERASTASGRARGVRSASGQCARAARQ